MALNNPWAIFSGEKRNRMQTDEKSLYDTETITNRLGNILEHGKQRMTDMGHTVTEKSKQVAELTDQCVHRNAWTTVLVSAGVGLLLGMLLRRR
jgi:ElaB/YqjD/DUF883 family membrane-anchored ribosome-binding protein